MAILADIRREREKRVQVAPEEVNVLSLVQAEQASRQQAQGFPGLQAEQLGVDEIQPGPISGESQSTLVPGMLAREALPLSTEKPALARTIKSIPGSALQFGGDIIRAITSPIQTAKSIGDLAESVAQLAVPGEQGREETARNVGSFIKERYGTIDAAKETFQTDPVGFMADLSTIGLGVGGVTRATGAVSRVGKVAKAGKAITKASAAFEPGSILLKGITAPAKLIPAEVPSDLFKSAAKFSTALPEETRNRLTKTALVNEIMPNRTGLLKLGEEINKLNLQITQKINAATQQGRVIPVARLMQDFNKLRGQALKTTGKPITELKTIESVRKQLLEANRLLQRKKLTAQEAQKLKQQIYRDTGSFYSSVTDSPTSVKAQQLIARNAKEAIQDLIPEIKELNKNDGALIELSKEIEKSAKRISNRDIMGIGAPIKGVAGGVAGGGAGTLAGLTVGLLDTPQIKARIAIVMDRLRRKGVTINEKSAAFRLGLAQAGRLEETR